MSKAPELEREFHVKQALRAGFDVAEDADAFLIPTELPGQDGRYHYDSKPVWNICDPREAFLKMLLDLAVTGQCLICE